MKKQVEVLAPCGSYEAAMRAIESGADAIYVGGTRFGARAFADNFTNEKIEELFDYAHMYGVKVYVTVNTLLFEHEFADAIQYTDFLYQAGADALIVQDIGLLSFMRKRYPDMDLHASTQMHLHNIDAVQELVDLGINRVVLSRECSLQTIKEIHEAFPDLELEVFCYGALCISYSGQCLFSSMIGGRSGNRGECAQACRLPYTLIEKPGHILETKGNYLLSPKDQNALSFVNEMIDAGVYSFKIEGRMKRPEYVASSVMVFKEAIEKALAHEPYIVTKETIKKLQSIFNRGFTLGHMKQQRGSALMSQERPNHQGTLLGFVKAINKKTKRAIIQLKDDVEQQDGIRILSKEEDYGFTLNFIYQQDLLVSHAHANEQIEIDLRDMHIEVGDEVRKTTSIAIMEEIANASAEHTRHEPIHMTLYMHKNEAMRLTISYDGQEVTTIGAVCDEARNRPVDEQRAKEQMSKLKDTPFVLDSFIFDSDGASITSISNLNQLRRDSIENFINTYKNSFKRNSMNKQPRPKFIPETGGPTYSVSVYTKEQVRACLEMHMPLIFVRDEDVYNEFKEYREIVLASSRIKPNNKHYNVDRLLACELGAVHEQKGKELYIDSWLNVTNSQSAMYFMKYHPKRITISEELTIPRIQATYKEGLPLEVIVYGKTELMVMQHCIINTNTVDTKELHCNMCKHHDYQIMDRKKEVYDILCDKDCFNHILHCRSVVAYDKLKALKDIGISYFRLNFTNESYEETLHVLQGYVDDKPLNIEYGYLGYLGKE